MSRGTALQMEYGTLRNETLRRIEMRQRFTAITLAFAGAFLGIGATDGVVALVYPPLAVFMAMGWAQNELRIRELSTYIRESLEAPTPDLNWETHVEKKRTETRKLSRRFVTVSHAGVFLFTQLMAVGIGLLTFTWTPLEWVLLGVDLAAVLVVVWIARVAHRGRNQVDSEQRQKE